MNLPVDTDYFYPVNGAADRADRDRIRAELGFGIDELVCVYTGKFTAEKNAVVLLDAVRSLRAQGLKVHALFIGGGEQATLLAGHPEATVLPFMPIRTLGGYYRAADIGVWMNESISFLDAACSGLPLLLSDTVKDVSHLKEFTGVFVTDDAASLAASIRSLADPGVRQTRAALAASLGHERFGGERYARRRVGHFRSALAGRAVTAAQAQP